MDHAPFSYREDANVPRFRDDRAVLVFDGKCVMCSSFARFILRRDRVGHFRLLAAQSRLGQALYRHYGLNSDNYETNLLIENGQVWLKSESSIRIFERLGFPWRLISVIRLLPRPMREWLYEIVARNRLRWFGARAACYLPEPAHADRFLG